MTTLPTSLVRFEQQLESAIRRQRSRRRRRVAVRGGVAVAAAAAVALGALGALPRTGPSAVERAAAALRVADGTILHTLLVGSLVPGPGQEATTVRIEAWQASSPPYDQLQIIRSGNRRLEVATVDGTVQLYDPQTNIVYTNPLQPKDADPSEKAGTTREKPPAAMARSDVKAGTVVSDGDRYRLKILGLLESGKVHEAGRVTVEGRAAIQLVSDDGAVTVLVDSDTYEPIEWRVSEDGRTAVTSFPTYEHLPATEETAMLLSLTGRHPDATIDDDPSHYQAAFERLNPKLR